jgi:hypothetical protein
MGDEIRMDLREIGWRGAEWIQLAQGRDQWHALVNTVMNLRVLAPLICPNILLDALFSNIPNL